MATAHATFVVDEIGHGEPIATHPGAEVARARVRKTFTGDFAGTGQVEMTTALAGDGRGYVGVEWLEGTLDGRVGGFALLHCGTADATGQSGTWPIVPGSGTDALVGIAGHAEVGVDAEGIHRFTLDYELPEG